MSVNIRIRHALKQYERATIIENLSLDIKSGEFFTLLGPSGCGKTTLLRMIAGFNTIEGGDFYFGEQRINEMNPSKRNIGMVFQNYAIFPSMNVRKNVAFGLRNRKIKGEELASQTETFMKLMHIDAYADRMPDRLSGGQQQRVALARALVIQPDVLLMDEPLSNLDAKLRVEMRTVIKNIQHDVGITTVYVTHDQEEAMAVSDRIAVMREGEIQHVGSPQAIYQRPANLFVSTFIGRSNVLAARLEAQGEAEAGRAVVCFSDGYRAPIEGVRADACYTRDILASVRPEEMLINKESQEGIPAVISDSVFLGLNTHYFVRTDSGVEAEIIQESELETILPVGSKVYLKVNMKKVNLFDAESPNLNILNGVRDETPRDL